MGGGGRERDEGGRKKETIAYLSWERKVLLFSVPAASYQDLSYDVDRSPVYEHSRMNTQQGLETCCDNVRIVYIWTCGEFGKTETCW